MAVEASLNLGTNPEAATIPESAVENNNSGALVNVINTDTSTVTLANAKVHGLAKVGTSQFSAYPLVVGTDVGAAFPVAVSAPAVNPTATVTSVAGTTAGTLYWSMPFRGSGYKKVAVYLDGYENDTTTAQTITFPTAFTYTPQVQNPGAVPGVTVSTTGLSLAPDTTTKYTAWVFVEGF